MIRSLLILAFLLSSGALHAEYYQQPEDFVAEAFDGKPPEPRVLWMTKERQVRVQDVLDHPYRQLRVRYWQSESKSVWVLDEIGKDENITIGFVISGQQISWTKVLAFRESRGWEIRFDAFTRQFQGAGLGADAQLDRDIDNITGATLSVNAYRRLAALALTLDRMVTTDNV